jgi:hypothetical protein
MIYSKEHDFLYLKNRKVGGSSTEICMSEIMPDNSIVTPVRPLDKRHKPRNYSGFYNHMSYKEVSYKIDLSNTLSCVVVRNPYDSVMSDFFLQLNHSKQIDNIFDYRDLAKLYFKNNIRKEWLKSSKHIYTINNEVCVKKIIKYEDGIENEINKVLNNFDLKLIIDIKQKSFRPKNIDYRDIFSKDHIKMIQNEWSWEFDSLGYSVE